MTDDAITCLAVDVGDSELVSQLDQQPNHIEVHRVDRLAAVSEVLTEKMPDCLLVGPLELVETDAVIDWLQTTSLPCPVLLYGESTARIEEVLAAGATDLLRVDETESLVAIAANRIRNSVDQYQARTTAEEREEQLYTLLENSSDRLSILDEQGRYKFVSPAIEHLMGYDPETLEGQSGFEYVHPEDRDRVQEAFERIVAEPEETHGVEYRIRDADGDWRWVESRGTNHLDNPVIEGIIVNSREVTDRRERQRRLSEEQAFTESIFAALPDVFYAFDEHGNFLRWNDRLSEVTGYSDEEIESMHPTDFVAKKDHAKVTEAIAEVFHQDTTVTVEAHFETKQGEQIPYEFTGAKVTDRNGDSLGLVGIGRDISTRKERQRRFEAVFNNTYQFIGLADADGTLLEANDTALRFGGLSREDVIEKKLWETYWFQDNDEAVAAAREAVEQARQGSLYREEITVQGATGTETIDFSVRPITDEQGDVRLLVPEGRLITELKERERHLKVLHRFLRHNLRNKMTVIQGAAAVLGAELDDDTYADHVSQIEGAATNLTELSETAHKLSRVALDNTDDNQPVALEQPLVSAMSDVQEEYPGATIRLTASVDSTVRADWRLQIVFEQLLENAAEHADHNTPVVEISVTERDDTVTIAVADNGPGIPEDELAGITTDEEPTQLTHGTGFGLWLVRSVVDDYAGSIEYKPRENGGSIMTVELQKAAGTQSSPEKQSEPSES